MQSKLLRVIQEKAIRPLGSHIEHPIDIRIISASNQSLTEAVRKGRFREDLYFRINVVELNIAPLRERKSDIPLLASCFLSDFNQHHSTQFSLAKEALKALERYDFPGNVRELHNILTRALTLSDNHVIQADELEFLDHRPSTSHDVILTEAKNLALHEKKLILQALEKTHWNRTKAAELLGITLRALRYRINKYGLMQESKGEFRN